MRTCAWLAACRLAWYGM